MNSFDWSNIGKRLKSRKDMIVYMGFPLSEKITIIPAGGVSGKITSYIERRSEKGIIEQFFQLDEKNYTLKNEDIIIVDENEKDESGVLGKGVAWISATAYNTGKKAEQTAGNLAEGFEKTKNRSFFEMLDFIGLNDLKKAIIVGSVITFAFLILIITIKLK